MTIEEIDARLRELDHEIPRLQAEYRRLEHEKSTAIRVEINNIWAAIDTPFLRHRLIG